MLSFVVALCTTVLLILALERFAEPRAGSRPILHRLSLLSLMPPVVFFTTLFMISYRPGFSALATLVVFAGIVMINNAKVAILREPLVFSDFALLRQAVKYPALYIKYVGVGKVVTIVAAVVGIVVAAVTLEPAVIARREIDDFFPALMFLAMELGLIYAITRGPFRRPFGDLLRRFGPTANVAEDMDKLSLVVCLIFYFLLSNEPDPKSRAERARALARPQRRQVPSPLPPDLKLPDVVAVQSESFFDARRLDSSIPRNLLGRYDACVAQSAYRGRLSVPAWGANTMRTEFSFLSGLPNEALGYHRFNPYLSLCKKPVWTVAHLFRSLGYRTICVHPFHASFFDRETVLPNLGFERFIDIEAFAEADTFGPYVGDVALAAKIAEVLNEDSSKPAFVFAITMENHGKWEKGRLDACPPDEGLDAAPLGSFELGLYLRHLRNTDRMVAKMVRELNRREEDAVFCLYGDHVPPFSAVFRQAKLEDPRTDYFIWRKGGSQPRDLDTTADALGRLMLDAAINVNNHEMAQPPAMAGE